MRIRNLGRLGLSASMIALTTALALPAAAQEAGAAGDEDTIVVTGIRGSMQRAMDIKRNASGVVDAISAEDIGKFPDTNLAESLQRITGVAIDRVNGEGSQITVRGFGPGFNIVTLNGRTMPTANVATVGGDQNSDGVQGNNRNFDFSNLASEGVTGLQVYKTGRASVPSGGLGATVNISTMRPLDNPGFQGSVGAKALHDTGVDRGETITPELSALFSVTDPEEKFGISLFGSYQERDGSSRSVTVNDWNIMTAGAFAANTALYRQDDPLTPENEAAQITNQPTNASQLISLPNDSRYHLAESHRARTNAQLTLQYRPIQSLTLTADGYFAQNEAEEQRTDQTNWFNRPFDEIVFEQNPVVASTLYLQEDISGVKDMGFEQQYRATKDTLTSLGFNAAWDVTDSFNITLDAHSSLAQSDPNNPMGVNSTMVSMGAPVIAAHSGDFSGEVPIQQYDLDDVLRGNGNNRLDVGDLGSQVARTTRSTQKNQVDEIRLDASWALGDFGELSVGVGQRQSAMIQTIYQTQQTLGDWGISFPGDIEALAPGQVEQYCLSCLFNDFTVGEAEIAFRADAVRLYQTLSPLFAADRNPLTPGIETPVRTVGVTADNFNQVNEDITHFYAQYKVDPELFGLQTHLLAGVRYEETEVESSALVALPTAIFWQSDNDFSRTTGATAPFSQTGKYDNTLPSVDFSVEFTDQLVGRISASKTIARAAFANLYASANPGNPPRPTALGGVPGGNVGNPSLLPLESENFDISLEWYYGDASFVSVGYYQKNVANFVGTGQFEMNLFGLRDPSSGAAGTRSGQAATALQQIGIQTSDVNLFTMTALIDNLPTVQDAINAFQAQRTGPGGSLNQTYVDQIIAQYDVLPEASDPLFTFLVSQPINNREAKIDGFELAFQHFFGDSGFGIAGSLTTVSGDVAIDVGADPTQNQFALIGLSDTYNISGIYENYGLSARLTYNWRDEFLNQVNRQSGRSPAFVEEYGQWDMSISYDLSDKLALSFEGINLTSEGQRHFGRDNSNLWFAQELDARYLIGARYKLN